MWKWLRRKAASNGEAMYHSLRSMALGVTADQLELGPEVDGDIFGVVLDWNLDARDSACMTLVAFANGEASIYLSTGGGMIGASQHEAVRAAAINLVSQAQLVMDRAAEGPAAALPSDGAEHFTLLCRTGARHILRGKGSDWDEADPLDALSIAAQTLIGEISRSA